MYPNSVNARIIWFFLKKGDARCSTPLHLLARWLVENRTSEDVWGYVFRIQGEGDLATRNPSAWGVLRR